MVACAAADEMKDLHALTRELGTQAVADAIGLSRVQLERRRAGRHPLTALDLHLLSCAYPDFDLAGTVQRVGYLAGPRAPRI